MAEYRISQLADRAGVPVTTLRHYEREGLLPAQRSASGYRLYDDESVDRLHFIATGKHLGLPLADIRDLVGVWETGLCTQVQERLRPLLRVGIAAADGQRAELLRFSARLRGALARLDGLTREGRCEPTCDFLLTGPRAELVAAELVAAEPARPVACSLSADAKAQQLDRWADLLAAGSAPVETDAGGWRVSFPSQLAGRITELVLQEQRCCPFFDFRVQYSGPVVHLEVAAPEHASALVAELLGRTGTTRP